MTTDSKIEITEVDDAEADLAEAVVCVKLTSPLLLLDNAISLCSKCGEAIQHRPNVPKTPSKICVACVGPLIEQEVTAVMVTPKSIAEVVAYLRRKAN